MEFEFTIPLTKDDLLCPSEDSYVVQNVYNVRGLPGMLNEAVVALNCGPDNIIHHFDVFFSVLKNFTQLDQNLKFNCWESLNKALTMQMSTLINIFDQNSIEQETKKQQRNILKMLCYLLTQFAEEFEGEDCKPSATDVRRKNGKAKKSSVALPFDWPEMKRDFITMITQLLNTNLVSLWEPPVAEEESINMFANCCYKFMENNGLNRDKPLRDNILHVLAILVKRYNQSLSVGVKVIQLLQHFEHLISAMAQLVHLCATEYETRTLVVGVLREISSIDPKDLERDTSGARNYSEFLVDLASRIPEHIMSNLSLLLCHLDNEPYCMRNGVLGVMGQLIVLRLNGNNLDDNMKKTRDKILDHLESHIHDVNSYVRSKVLQIWQDICREKAIPVDRQQVVLGLVIGRLRDGSTNVRKNAIIYLKDYLMCNPFGSKFSIAEVEKKLQEETAKLKQMDNSKDESRGTSAVDLKRWQELEHEVKRVVDDNCDVEDIVDEDGEHVEFQGDVNEALEFALFNIKKQMVAGDHFKALAVFKAAVATWPDYDLFNNYMHSKGVESSENREEIVSNHLSLLKKIFLNPNFGPTTKSSSDIREGEDQESQVNTNDTSSPDGANEISKQRVVVQFLKDYLSFHASYQQALTHVSRLMASHVATDVHESIDFVVIAQEFGLNNALLAVRRLLNLIWSKDNSIKSKVVDAYKRLYLDPPVQGQRAKCEAIIKNLSALLSGATIGDLASLDELAYKLMKEKLIPNNVVHLLWEKFAMKDSQTTKEQRQSALKLLGMFARGKHEMVKSNVDVLVTIGLCDQAKDDSLLVKDTCTMMLKLNSDLKVYEKQRPLRFTSDHVMFQRLNDILVSSITTNMQGMWVPMAEEAIKVIYNLAQHPDKICSQLIKNLTRRIFAANEDEESSGSTEKGNDNTLMSCSTHVLARYLAAAGHIALQQVIYLETSVLGEIKRRQRLKEDNKEHKNGRNTVSGGDQTSINKEGASESLEDEMGLTGATAEDAEAECIKKICDHEIVTGGENLLSILGHVVIKICTNPVKYSDVQLQTAASLALSKFMLVSAEFCENNLQLLVTILEKSPHEVIRSNTIISLGDLTTRFPNLLEPWTANLYARLRDDSPQVRMNTMKIMTRLILNDMVKVKGQISEIATCLQDEDSRIAELAKCFFSELSKKGNAVYNILPDIISRLSDPETGIQENPFKSIMSYLFSFIKKDRHCESLVEKLCHRFRATRTERQWMDLSFCLAQLSYNERSLRKLHENIACFQSTLSNNDVYSYFQIIIGKCKKTAKAEMKIVVEEFEGRIVAFHEKVVEQEAGYERAGQASFAARVLVEKVGKKAKTSCENRTPALRKTPRNRKKPIIEFDSDDEDLFDQDWGEDEIDESV
ncbi:condensin complex subunit 1-like isoform X2 [Xenia sp. Carnegie-2017]|uniref:condensin complex subunit 1-like isoform X1 n=1 Tax=Xenia sp. Carnegie-2017 TaxID=2897299 RepID=UPI001F03A504|nr:condensin complex subunit 1-like isoform X1 [Xenia sp. Carnegie-2017]XP_046850200.1 condensin complex subunit 1-like isoform X2 [Xenia sp. Carnegie-2017]